eukprot:3874845-Amphidinium_carterae.1
MTVISNFYNWRSNCSAVTAAAAFGSVHGVFVIISSTWHHQLGPTPERADTLEVSAKALCGIKNGQGCKNAKTKKSWNAQT